MVGAILYYSNLNGKPEYKSWNPIEKKAFPVLIKFYLDNGTVVEESIKTPTSFYYCNIFVERMKERYGRRIRQLFIWDLEAIEEMKKRYQEGEVFG